MRFLVCIIILLPASCVCSLSLGFAITGLASMYAGWHYTKCYFGMCCRDSWNHDEFAVLQTVIRNKLYGQHIAEEMMVRHLKSHFLDHNPKKALVLSLHGTTGSGKNYITSMIVQQLLPTGMKNRNVKIWSAKHHFSDDQKIKTHAYEEEMKKTIGEMVSSCSRSIFIFDEANELPSGLLDVLKPMMDEYPELDGVDYRKATFFFLSNTGATEINKVMLKFKQNGRERSDMKISDFQPLIQDGAFNEKGGLWKSKLIEKNLIDTYVPFLPLERSHIELCIVFYLRMRNCPVDQEFVDKIAESVNYEPAGFRYFAAYGCRGIDNHIKQEMEDSCIYNTPKSEL